MDTRWRGEDRKLLLHANRNGFFYVIDRTNGRPLLATRMVDKLTWASGINETDWTPRLLPNNETNEQGVKTAPAVRGATNWYATAYNPATRLYYVMTVEDLSNPSDIRFLHVLQGADAHLELAKLALARGDKATGRQHAEEARRLATCDGPPDYTYKVAYDEAGALLKQLGKG